MIIQKIHNLYICLARINHRGYYATATSREEAIAHVLLQAQQNNNN